VEAGLSHSISEITPVRNTPVTVEIMSGLASTKEVCSIVQREFWYRADQRAGEEEPMKTFFWCS